MAGVLQEAGTADPAYPSRVF